MGESRHESRHDVGIGQLRQFWGMNPDITVREHWGKNTSLCREYSCTGTFVDKGGHFEKIPGPDFYGTLSSTRKILGWGEEKVLVVYGMDTVECGQCWFGWFVVGCFGPE